MYKHLRNARYLGSMKPFSEGEPGSLGLVNINKKWVAKNIPPLKFNMVHLKISGKMDSELGNQHCFTKHFRYLKLRNLHHLHLYKQYGYGLCKAHFPDVKKWLLHLKIKLRCWPNRRLKTNHHGTRWAAFFQTLGWHEPAKSWLVYDVILKLAYEIIPIKLGRISSPNINQPTFWFFPLLRATIRQTLWGFVVPSRQICSYHADFIVQVLKTKGLHLVERAKKILGKLSHPRKGAENTQPPLEHI